MPEAMGLTQEQISDQWALLESLVPEDEPVYESVGLIPTDTPTFFFNKGHITTQIGPNVPTFLEYYGAVPHRIKSRARSGYDLCLGIPSDEMARWARSEVLAGNMSGPRSNLAELIHGIVQQLDQGYKPDTVVYMLTAALEGDVTQEKLEKGNQILDMFEHKIRNTEKQNEAATAFSEGLHKVLRDTGNVRRMRSIEDLRRYYDALKSSTLETSKAVVVFHQYLEGLREFLQQVVESLAEEGPVHSPRASRPPQQ